MLNLSKCGLVSAAASFVLIASSTTIEARQLSPQQALLRAQKVDASMMHTMDVSLEDQTPRLEFTATSADGTMNTVYLFNCGKDGGFLLVSADDNSGAALLGYSRSGSIDASEMPENMRWWISQYSREIASVATNSTRDFDYGDFEIPELAEIAPIVKTHWNQMSPYNLYCPMLNGKRTPTGCVATAMSQVMKVHNWPEHGMGSHSYRPSAIGTELTVNFADTTFQWDKMLDTYSTTSDAESQAAVASLMYCTGVAVSMQYSASSSSGYTTAARALVNYFDYDKGLRILQRDYYGIQDWFQLLYSELEAGRPVLYSGTNESAGHAFICDGYDKDGYFHINWGWGGLSNGYFLLTALNPSDQGAGGSSAGYNNGQSMIIGIQPPVEGSKVLPVMEFNGNFQMSQNSYSRSDATVHVIDRRGIFCQSVGSVTATMGLKITDSAGDVSYIPGTSTKTYSYGQGQTGYNIEVDKFPQAEGEYEVAPAVMDESGDWFECEVKMTANRSLNLKITADSLLFSPTTVARITATEVEVLSPIYPGLECGFRAVLINNSEEEFFERVAPTLVLNHADIAQCDPLSIELLPGQSGVFEWIGDFPASVAPGEYLMWFVDGNSLDVSTEGYPVTVLEAPTGATEFTLTTGSVDGSASTEETPTVFPDDKLTFRVSVDCNSGYFSDNVCGAIFHADGTGINVTEHNYIAAGPGMTTSADYEYDKIHFEPEKLYYILASGTHRGRMGNKMYFKIDPLAGVEVVGTEKCKSNITVTHRAGIVEVTAKADIKSISIYSVEGSEVCRRSDICSRRVQLEVGSLSTGLYVLSVDMVGAAPEAVKIVLP